MNVKDAIKILKRENYIIEELENGMFHVTHPCECELETSTIRANIQPKDRRWFLNIYTGRELIKKAKYYTSEDNSKTAIKKNVKHYDARKNRNATKQKILKDKLDDIPQNGKVKTEDIWSWD